MYEEYAEQADTWLSSKEAFLANNDLGVSEAWEERDGMGQEGRRDRGTKGIE